MKKTRFSLLLVAMLISSVAFSQNWWKSAIRGQGDVVSEDLNLKEFDGITLAFSGDVYIKQGSTQSVRVEAQQNIIDNISTEVEGKHWRIKYDRSVRNAKRVKVYITMKDLTVAKVSGSGNIVGDGSFTGLGDVRVGVSGSGNVELEMEASGLVDSRISGSGNIKLHGNAGSIDVGISGSGNVRAHDLAVAKGYVKISGSGDADVNATDELEVRISGSGDVNFKGSPKLRSKVSGSGDVNSF